MYKSLEERINKFPQGAPPSDTLYKILNVLYTEQEAKLVAQLPVKHIEYWINLLVRL